MNTSFGLTGRVKAAVINGGRTVLETGWSRNLWLDAGLDQMASTPLCDLFAVAVKGTGTTPTLEDLSGTANTYSIANGSATLNRTAGTRNFTAGDVGKLVRFSTTPFAEFTIAAFTDIDTVEVTPNATAAVSNKKIFLYHVQQVGLDAEVGRTQTYSAVPNENKTVTAANVRTFTRTFLFDGEDTLVEVVPVSNTYSQAGNTVTREVGTRDFVAGDIGSTIRFKDSELTAVITAVPSVTTATVDTAQANLAQNIVLSKPNSAKTETPANTNTYSRAGAVVTRVTGTRDFTAADVGKIMHFDTSNVEAKITVFTDADTVTVDTSGALAAQTIKLYGFTDYREIGFSHTDERGNNINVRVLLAAAVRTYVSTPLRASDQLKLTYECKLTVTPNVATTGSLAAIISDPGNLMSGNKNGKSAIESFATSTVASDGETDISFPDLEPFYEGFAALSLMAEPLAPLTNKVRDTSTAFVPMTADPYLPGTFFKTFQGLFGLNDAVSNSWRSLMIYDPDSKNAIFTFLYDAAQKKDGEHTFQIGFKKSWNRDLS